MSALKVMFIDPAMSIAPSIGSPMSVGHLGPGAVRADQILGPDRGALAGQPVPTSTVTPSASCSWPRYSVENRAWAPRSAALRSRIGSR